MLAGFAAAISGGAQGFNTEEAEGGGQAGSSTGAIITGASIKCDISCVVSTCAEIVLTHMFII